jgi:hypothetical protein
MRRSILALVILFLISVIVLSPIHLGREDGMGNGNFQYGDCSCHQGASPVVIEMSASKTTLSTGEQVNVDVKVSGGSDVERIGCMLLSNLSSVGSLPSDDGWAILSDPSGNAFDYNEIEDYNGQHTFIWTLQAPTSPGDRVLYAKVNHGSDEDPVTKEYSQGLLFQVGASSGPVVTISSPSPHESVSGNITISATVSSDRPVQYVTIMLDDLLLLNNSAPPYSVLLDTTLYESGAHIIVVTAVDDNGSSGQAVVNIEIQYQETVAPGLWGWELTIIACTLASIAAVLLLLVLVMRFVSGKGKGGEGS